MQRLAQMSQENYSGVFPVFLTMSAPKTMYGINVLTIASRPLHLSINVLDNMAEYTASQQRFIIRN